MVDLGLEELGDGEAVLLVEWGDAVEEVLPDRPRHDRADQRGAMTSARRIVVDAGRAGVDRSMGALESVLAPWSVAS